MGALAWRRWREGGTVAAVSAGLVLALLLRTNLITAASARFALPLDHRKYAYMAAGHVGTFHIAPFCWRIGVPLLAQVLPFGLQDNFLLIAACSLWASGVLVYSIARAGGRQAHTAWLAFLLFASL